MYEYIVLTFTRQREGSKEMNDSELGQLIVSKIFTETFLFFSTIYPSNGSLKNIYYMGTLMI